MERESRQNSPKLIRQEEGLGGRWETNAGSDMDCGQFQIQLHGHVLGNDRLHQNALTFPVKYFRTRIEGRKRGTVNSRLERLFSPKEKGTVTPMKVKY